ncbi:E3 ubiquitin-protein ligase SIAH2-like [Aethina tumida]|uniref:E3 ubiquitin-protein ligase SIAH2-like n=1 Tax=Aethina tumida TaxID=116153 RepID=UPI002148CAAE|nr:E3 ubiquitin-protein ligase SIAH2-like [Aethina tumida]
MSTKIMYDLISEFKCTVCYDYMKPPILMCFTGHSCCNSCFRRMNQCPECRGKKSNFRNLNLERIYYILVFPCRNAEYGCAFTAKGTEMMTHEDKCIYSYLPCPFAKYGCTWSGVYKSMEDHLKEAHDCSNDAPDICDLEGFDEGADCWRQALNFDGHLFILCVIKEGESFWFGVYSIIDTDQEYDYEMTFVDLGRNRTARFNGTCTTHKEYATEEYNRHNIQRAPGMLVESFRQSDLVQYKVEIFRKS